ncbi:MAG: cysteine synthase B [Candidatus Aenigmatarchaeota archaeon]|nr:MAG: cysteine synthase B [Candidatus Aenigmarchaeota archaeon]
MAQNVLELIGETPVVKINRMNPNPNVEIYMKLEWYNPMGSVKDRIALSMIEDAERSGALKKGMVVLEATSGNTGIGLAMVCAVKGYRCLFTLPESVSMERKKLLKAMGADLIVTPAEEGTDGAIRKARELAKSSRYFYVNQFSNESNWRAHYEGTGPEIWRQMNGYLTHFVAGMGTSGTLMGVSKFLKDKGVKIIGVEPVKGHKQEGLKNMEESIVPEIYDPDVLDEKITVRDEDAFETARRLLREEGIFGGKSTGSALWAATQISKRLNSGRILVISPDHGFKYLSTDLYNCAELFGCYGICDGKICTALKPDE